MAQWQDARSATKSQDLMIKCLLETENSLCVLPHGKSHQDILTSNLDRSAIAGLYVSPATENPNAPEIAKSKSCLDVLQSEKLEQLVEKWDPFTQEASRPWCGWLRKCSNYISWQPHWFQLNSPDLKEHSLPCCCAVLSYHSDSKGERRLFVQDVRRETWLDSGDSIAFSVGVIETVATDQISNRNSGRNLLGRVMGGRRVQLRAATAVEAVVLLICLLRILHPDRMMPTMLEAVKAPKRILQTLI
jgi:hypothetical protein